MDNPFVVLIGLGVRKEWGPGCGHRTGRVGSPLPRHSPKCVWGPHSRFLHLGCSSEGPSLLSPVGQVSGDRLLLSGPSSRHTVLSSELPLACRCCHLPGQGPHVTDGLPEAVLTGRRGSDSPTRPTGGWGPCGARRPCACRLHPSCSLWWEGLEELALTPWSPAPTGLVRGGPGSVETLTRGAPLPCRAGRAGYPRGGRHSPGRGVRSYVLGAVPSAVPHGPLPER